MHVGEWGRLLVNRGCGLLFAQLMIDGQAPAAFADEDQQAFITRQVQKAWLAVGDVWLADQGAYDYSVRERARRAHEIAEKPSWWSYWEAAVEHKLRPKIHYAGSEEQLSEVLPVLAGLLAKRSVAQFRPLVNLVSTLRHIAPQQWMASGLLSYPRQRLQATICAADNSAASITQAANTHCGSVEQFRALSGNATAEDI